MGRICRKRRFYIKSGVKERVGDGKLIIISITVSDINDRIRFFVSCTTAINTSNTIRTQTGAAER